MTASSTQGHDAAERSFGLTPAAEGLVRLTEGGHFDATLVLVEVVEAEAEPGPPAPPNQPAARRSPPARAFALLDTASRPGRGAGKCPQAWPAVAVRRQRKLTPWRH